MNIAFGIVALLCLVWSMVVTNRNLQKIKAVDGSEHLVKKVRRALIGVILVFFLQLLNVIYMVVRL